MGQRWALGVLTASSFAALWSFVAEAPGLFAAVAAIFPVALMAVGAARGGSLGRGEAVALGLVLGVLVAMMAGLFIFRGGDGPGFGGLPAGAAVQIYGLFLAPLLVTSLGYAWTFERSGLREQDLESLRERFPESLEVDEERGDGVSP